MASLFTQSRLKSLHWSTSPTQRPSSSPSSLCPLLHSPQVTMVSLLFLVMHALAWALSSCCSLCLEVTVPPDIHIQAPSVLQSCPSKSPLRQGLSKHCLNFHPPTLQPTTHVHTSSSSSVVFVFLHCTKPSLPSSVIDKYLFLNSLFLFTKVQVP